MTKKVPAHVFANLKGLVFDCDGVLLDSRRANITFYNYLRTGLGLPVLTDKQQEYVHMSTYEQALDHIIPKNLRRCLPDLLNNVERHIDYYSLLNLETGLLSMLDWLRQGGTRLAICTNRTDPMDDLLLRFNLLGYFTPVQTATNSLPKPHPDGLQKILQEWNADPYEVAFIGDSKVDGSAAQAAGVHFWSFKNISLDAELHVPGFEQLHEWLRNFSG
jgi:HAD superfamily hydrolase (TIGR01509 family)